MNRRKKILYLVHRLPFPPNRGDRIRTYHILRYLADRFDVSLATLADEPIPSGVVEELHRWCVNVAIERLPRSRWLRAALSLASGRTATEGLFEAPALRRTIQRWATSNQFDVVLVVCSSMVQYLNCPELKSTPAIVDLIDVDSQKWFDYAAKASGPKRWLFELEGRRLRDLEAALPAQVKAISLVSEAEANLYRRIVTNNKTIAVSNGVDLDYFSPTSESGASWQPLSPGECCQIAFIGALDYRANVDAIMWFTDSVWNEIRRRHSTLQLAIVGRRPTISVQRLNKVPGIRIFADVPDVRPYISAANVVIAPLRIARGIQNKVLEAMAMSKPVVASPEAVEGIGARNGIDLEVASSQGEWVRLLDEILIDESRRNRLGAAARRFVEDQFQWAETLTGFDSCLADASTMTMAVC